MLSCDHVALVVREIEPVLGRLLGEHGLEIAAGPIEEFPGEGTREVYLGDDAQTGRLLLMQPLEDDGPYARALAERGPGLHHVAFGVPSAREFVRAHPGWLLHPESLDSFAASRTLWLARPGVGILVEVQERGAVPSGAALVERVEIPVADATQRQLLDALSGTTELAPAAGGDAPATRGTLTLGGEELEIARLAG